MYHVGKRFLNTACASTGPLIENVGPTLPRRKQLQEQTISRAEGELRRQMPSRRTDKEGEFVFLRSLHVLGSRPSVNHYHLHFSNARKIVREQESLAMLSSGKYASAG
jgi:hypothetical protein